MTSLSISRSSERFAELSHDMRAEARVLEHLSKLFVVQWNADAPGIHSLPPEILHFIFSLVAEIDRPSPPYDCHAHVGYRTPMITTHPRNCTPNWDAVVMLDGYVSDILWASDVGLLPRGLHEMLERSQDLPVTVRAYVSRCRPEAQVVLAALISDSRQSGLALRVNELDILDARKNHFEAIDTALKARVFPLLETFYPWSSMVLSSLDIGASADGVDPDTEMDADVSVGVEHLLFILRASASTIETLVLSRCAFSDAASDALERRPVSHGLFARSSSSARGQASTPFDLPKLLHLHLRTVLGCRGWDVYSRFLASITLPASARLIIATRLYGGFDQEVAQDTLASCLLAGRQICDLDGLAISDRPVLEYHDVGNWKQTSFSFYSSAPIQVASQSDRLHAESPWEYPVRLVFEEDQSDYVVPEHDHDILGTLLKSSILSEVTTMAFLNREPFWDKHSMKTRAILTSLLESCTHVYTLFIRLPDAWEYTSDDRSLLDILCEGPVLPRLKHLSLQGRVVMSALPEQLDSRPRSLREAGHASKLLELRLKVDEDRVRIYRDEGGDIKALSSTLHEYTDSVDIRA
ncbi:hypothetical protein PENSPDRAFT_669587 [Peniophora sp. CONT]|nr:hypothetical protein PENSPDRAFT_669587 [Peniophora sp. CONT]